MEKVIKFDEEELNGFIAVLRLIETEDGLSRHDFCQISSMYFKKFYKTKVVFKEVFGKKMISLDESTIKIGEKWYISVEELLTTIINLKLCYDNNVQMCDASGEKDFHSNGMPVMRSFIKISE